jgi:hypothetical protein
MRRAVYFGCRNCGLSYELPEGYAMTRPFEVAHARRCAIPVRGKVKAAKAAKAALSRRRKPKPKVPETPDWLKRVLGL